MILDESNVRKTYLGCAEDVGISDTMVIDHQFKDTIDVRQFHLDFVAMTLMEIIYIIYYNEGSAIIPLLLMNIPLRGMVRRMKGSIRMSSTWTSFATKSCHTPLASFVSMSMV